MFTLNLPDFEYKLRKKDAKNYIFDPLRRKYVFLSPEEWVRQHFCHYLINHKNYPAGRIANECSIRLEGLTKRCDTIVYNAQMEVLMLVEYKAPDVVLNQEVFNQIVRYNWVLQAKYLTVSNGMTHYCCRMDYLKNKVEFLEDIPFYSED
ncbi:MAG: type I restriction enzyme HsdR N-terminal domain-containing protein [Bacteroidales bacterium]|nr:type I restriction enzyme HsdR N-terminal domain-containing protein [Bacteroidales bacterium]MDD3431108.1 type I restriction enzyme HsdR N-terminal domain-containing protein [Bacteroidales bacterium]MDD4360895.1 type I restriction enzyme HsdR N-terminal domain-containing protein [Bacteroidales bacterium]MDD4430095.1 type I restriction enzyme HsdR N-terminal domain-containing protein [Bacteroidales bacterium]